MILSYKVTTPRGEIGIADNNAGDKIFETIFKEYGDCKVVVYDRNDLFGRETDKVAPLQVTTIKELFA